jgi:hypothetical protein
MTNELQKFDRVLKEILKVSHSEIKDKLDAEKVAKKWKKAKKSSASREGV